MKKKTLGTFNLGSNNGLSKAEFAFEFAKNLNLPTKKMQKTSILNNKVINAYRPRNMLMNVSKFENKFSIKLPNLIDEIKLVAKDY